MAGPQKPAAPTSAPPTPAERAMMERIRSEAEQDRLSKEAYDKASPLGRSIPNLPEKKAKGGSIKGFCRGGGIESRGKTKGRFV